MGKHLQAGTGNSGQLPDGYRVNESEFGRFYAETEDGGYASEDMVSYERACQHARGHARRQRAAERLAAQQERKRSLREAAQPTG